MPPIPPDIWRYIAQFISQHDLRRMLDINSTFFQVAMDARYRDFAFDDFDDAKVEAIQRLRDPTLAHRVRHLHVIPVFSHEYFVGQNPEQCVTPGFLGYAIQTMVDVVSCLSTVTDFSIDWYSCHAMSLPSEEQMLPFFIMAWKTFGPGLQRFALTAPLNTFPKLFSVFTGFTALQVLEIEIVDKWGYIPDTQHEKNFFVAVLAPFINKVASTLRNLSITSWQDELDLSQLFCSLETIPNLERLKIHADFALCGLSEPLGVTRILHDHVPTLRHVKWTSSSMVDFTGDPFTEWQEKHRSDEAILSNLLTLKVKLQGRNHLDLMLEYLRRSVDTLTSFTLRGPYLSYQEVNDVVSIFAHRRAGQHLNMLSLRVDLLSVELLKLLVWTLPYLNKLKLDIRDIKDVNGADYFSWDDELLNVGFISHLKKQNFRHWKLSEIDFKVHCSRGQLPQMLESLFAECIPSCSSYVNGIPYEIKEERWRDRRRRFTM